MNKQLDRMPSIRFNKYNEDWNQVELSNLMDFSNGINAPKENYGKGRKMISVLDILAKGPLEYENIKNSVEVAEHIEEKNKVESGDLIFVRSSEITEEVGWSKAYLQDEYALYSGFSIRGKKKNEFDPYFMELSLNFFNRKQIERKAGGSTRFNVNQSILKDLIVSLPSIKEANKIASFFNKLDKIIFYQQQLLNDHKQLKKAMLQKMFPQKGEMVPRIRFARDTDNWEEKNLNELVTIKTGKLDANARDSNGIYPFFTCARETYKTSTYSFDGENLLIAGNGDIGFIKYYKGKFDAYQRTYILGNIKVDAKFLQHLLAEKLPERIHSLTYGSTMPYITISVLADMELMIPDLAEQTKTGNFFKKLDDTIDLHQKKLETYQELKKAMLQKMFV